MSVVIRAASFSLIGSPSPFCRAIARWMIFVVGKKDAAPITATKVIFSQKMGSGCKVPALAVRRRAVVAAHEDTRPATPYAASAIATRSSSSGCRA